MSRLTPETHSSPTFRLEIDPRLVLALALSILLHLLAALVMQIEWRDLRLPRLEERAMEVEVVPERPQPPLPPQPPPPEPVPQPTPPSMPLQHPQLRPAPLAEKSAAPHPVRKPDLDRHVSAEAGPGLSASESEHGQKVQTLGPLSQSAQDMILAQVVAMWRFNTTALRGSNWVLTAKLTVNRDGTLAGPMNKDAPWKPDEIIRGYSSLPDGTAKRMMETFLLALRLAQPLKLPPDDGKPWPRGMVLHFKPGDL